jgi:hypothetical protein
MQSENVNHKAINDTYKNAHIALQSINDIMPSVDDRDLRNELKSQQEGYQSVIDEISDYMKENGIEMKDIGFMQKAMLWGSIKMKTIMDDSKNQIAELMIKGTVTGINELTAMKNECENYDEKVCEYVEKLLRLEEEYEQRLKKYL